MSMHSYGYQVRTARANKALREKYLNPQTAEVGDLVPYREEDDDTDDAAWSHAERILRRRDMCLYDCGDGYYIVAWCYAADGSPLDPPVVDKQPASVAWRHGRWQPLP